MTILPLEDLVSKLDKIGYVNPECYFPSCQNLPISSHTIAENNLYRLNPDLMQVVTIEQRIVQRLKRHQGANIQLFIPIDKSKFSTFSGFCYSCDTRIFQLIDQFDGKMTPEKATLIHYRIICYGIHNIQLWLGKHNFTANQNCVEAGEIVEVKNVGREFNFQNFYKRLMICLAEHQARKKALETMIITRDFRAMRFEILSSNKKPDFLFSGRSSSMLHPENTFLKQNGYPFMPWVTYMTLPYEYGQNLVFCWLSEDNKRTTRLRKTLQNKNYKIFLEKVAYGLSDSLAIERNFFLRHQRLIEEIQEKYGH